MPSGSFTAFFPPGSQAVMVELLETVRNCQKYFLTRQQAAVISRPDTLSCWVLHFAIMAWIHLFRHVYLLPHSGKGYQLHKASVNSHISQVRAGGRNCQLLVGKGFPSHEPLPSVRSQHVGVRHCPTAGSFLVPAAIPQGCLSFLRCCVCTFLHYPPQRSSHTARKRNC